MSHLLAVHFPEKPGIGLIRPVPASPLWVRAMTKKIIF
jgi:hypothetical protein